MNKIVHRNPAFWGRTSTIIIADGYGFVMVSQLNDNKPVAVIHDLIVHKDRRGEGLGRELLEDAEEEAREMGALAIRLSCDKGSWLEEWYKRHGFENTTLDAPCPTHVVLEKSLTEE